LSYSISHLRFAFHGYPLHESSRFRICGFSAVRKSFGSILPTPAI
jgi:hypothetical protein